MSRATRTRALCAVVWAALLAGGCAARSRERTLAADLAERLRLAHAAADRGCYVCLVKALDLAETVGAVRPGFGDARQLAFDAAVLLTLRERELGLVDHGYLERARVLAAGDADAPVVEMAGAIPTAVQGPFRDRWDDVRTGRALTAEQLPGWRAAVAASGRLPARYALLSVECTYSDVSGLTRETVSIPAPGEEPALSWRRATCLGRDTEALAALVSAVPEFAEATYHLGVQSLMAGRLIEAESRVRSALEAIPGWPDAAVTLGNIRLALERFDASREAFDAALALEPLHPSASIGKVQALSYLGAHAEAIRVADAMIARGTWMIGDAQYWRAWNLARLDRVEDAESSVAEAKRLLVNAAVFKLAGVIALRREKLDAARSELATARERAPDDCEVAVYAGYVESAAQKPREAGTTFALAAACYAHEAAEGTARLARLSADPSSEPGAIERCRRDVASAREEEAASHFRAASAFASAGAAADARDHATAALRHPAWAEKSRGLLLGLPRP